MAIDHHHSVGIKKFCTLLWKTAADVTLDLAKNQTTKIRSTGQEENHTTTILEYTHNEGALVCYLQYGQFAVSTNFRTTSPAYNALCSAYPATAITRSS
jgi:hypothetical protein